jgi:hypothetical protein
MNYEIKEPETSPSIKKQNKRVFISLVGDSFSSKFVIALFSTVGSMLRDNVYDVNIITGTDPNMTTARLNALGTNVVDGADQKPFGRDDYDYWISIESSCIFTADSVIALLKSLEDHHVVTGLYRTDLDRFNVVDKWDVEYFRKNGAYEMTTLSNMDEWKKNNPDNKHRKVCSTGMGFLGMRKEVLTTMKYPYFNSDMSTVFTEEGKVLTSLMSDEMAFSKNVQKAGFSIVANTDLVVGYERKFII